MWPAHHPVNMIADLDDDQLVCGAVGDGDDDDVDEAKAGVVEPEPSRKPASSSGSSKGKNKDTRGKGKQGQRGPGKGRKYCRACRRWLDTSCFGANDALCRPDKRALDNILRLARKQGPKAQEWVNAVKHCDEGLYNAVKTDHQLCPEDESGAARRRGSSQCFMTYIDTVVSKSVVDHLIIGEMLNEKAYYELSATGKGGKLSDEAMRVKWVEMLEESRRGERLFDHDGPNQCIQLWVKTGKQINFREALAGEAAWVSGDLACDPLPLHCRKASKSQLPNEFLQVTSCPSWAHEV